MNEPDPNRHLALGLACGLHHDLGQTWVPAGAERAEAARNLEHDILDTAEVFLTWLQGPTPNAEPERLRRLAA